MDFTVADLILLLKKVDVSTSIIFQTQWGANLQIKNLTVLPEKKILILMKDEREEEIDIFAKQLIVNLEIDNIQPQLLDN